MAAEPTNVTAALNSGGTYSMKNDETVSAKVDNTKNLIIKILGQEKDLTVNKQFTNNANLAISDLSNLKSTVTLKNNGNFSLINVKIEENNNITNDNGLIYNNIDTSVLNLDQVTFKNNTATKNGLILNKGTLTASNTVFEDNKANGNGLIYNEKTMAFSGSFKNNENNGKSNGLIYNNSGAKITELNANFENNKIKDAGSLSGIVYNEGTIEKLSGKYSGNIATDGGAIYNKKGAITLTDVEFTNNSATTKGGAIYNASTDSIINIIGKVSFSGNKVNGVSNALYNNEGTVNITGGDVVFDDAIDGSNGIININTASADDVVAISNAVKGNKITLTKGVLKLSSDKATFDSNVGFVADGGSLNLQDNTTNEHSLGKVELTKDLNTSLDVDLGNTKGDVLSATSVSGDSKVVVKNIKVLTDTNAHITKIKIAAEKIKESVKLDDTLDAIETGDNRYLVEYETDATSGNLKFGNDKALETAVQFKKADKNFNMTNTAEIEVDLGKLVGPELTINGNNNVINGNNKKGMELAGDQTLNLNDVSVKGFDGAFAENNGTMNIAAGAGNELNLDSGISGSGDINAQGEGKLNINSDIAANKMTVSVSELNLKSDIAANEITVLGGELNLKSGSELANVENFVANGGVLNVGDQTVNLKKAEFNDGSTLAINVKSDGNGLLKADSLTVNGGQLKATLGQGLVDMHNKQKNVTLLESGTEFVNKFADVMENNMYRFEKAEKAGDYIISLVKTAEDVSQESGGTQNNAETAKGWVDGNKFEQGSVSADVADKLADLAQNDAKGFNEALSALAPADAPLVRTISVNHNNQVFSAVSRQLDDSAARQKAYGLASGDTALDGVGVWAQVMDNRIKLDDNARAYGFEVNDYGVALGLEKQLSSSVKTGVGYSYFTDDADAYLRDVDVDTHTAFVYGEYRPNNWYTNAIASYGYSKYDENKHVAGDVYKAKYDVDNIGAQVMTGYNASVARVDVTPEAGLRYNNIHRDNYVDSAGQAVKAETMDVMTAVAGLKVGKDLVSCFGVRSFYWRPEARLAATYDLISDKENAVVSLSNGSGYVVKGQRLNRFGVEAGAGVTFYLSPDVESSIGYEGKFRSHYQDHTGYVSAKYKF